MIVALCPLDNGFDTALNVEAIDAQLALAVAPDGSLLHPFEPHRRAPLRITLTRRTPCEPASVS